VAVTVHVEAEDPTQDEEGLDVTASTSSPKKYYLVAGCIAMAILIPAVVSTAVLLLHSNGDSDKGAAQMQFSITMSPSAEMPPSPAPSVLPTALPDLSSCRFCLTERRRLSCPRVSRPSLLTRRVHCLSEAPRTPLPYVVEKDATDPQSYNTPSHFASRFPSATPLAKTETATPSLSAGEQTE
jgi:hypothetical protein